MFRLNLDGEVRRPWRDTCSGNPQNLGQNPEEAAAYLRLSWELLESKEVGK